MNSDIIALISSFLEKTLALDKDSYEKVKKEKHYI